MSNSTVIGTTSSFYGVATFQSQPIITSTILANNDNSTNIATTAWANSFLTYKQTQPNTWTGAQTFTTANVSVLNVFKTSVDTINASSITSDMTIGANLNGGSLTIGSANATTSINSNVTNIATQNLTTNGGISMATGTNAVGTYVNIGTTAGLPTMNLRATGINIGSDGLPATGVVNIGNGTNTAGAQVSIGSTSLSAVNIKGTQTNVETTTLNLNTNGTGNTLIGTSGGSNSITINRPLTVGYAPPALTSFSQIGFTENKSGSIIYPIGGGNAYSMKVFNNLPLGVYSLTANFCPFTTSNIEVFVFFGSINFAAVPEKLEGGTYAGTLSYWLTPFINQAMPASSRLSTAGTTYISAGFTNLALVVRIAGAVSAVTIDNYATLTRLA